MSKEKSRGNREQKKPKAKKTTAATAGSLPPSRTMLDNMSQTPKKK
jgi:hypothetical protein